LLFEASVSFPANYYSTLPLVADWDGDGLPDVVVCSDYRLSFYTNRCFRPVIKSFTPALVTPGTTITITGYNFTGTTSVTIGGAPVASFTVVSSTQITVVAGEGMEGDIVVTTPYGTASISYVSFVGPVINTISPLSGPVGSTVTITGNNFSAVTASDHVFFGAVAAQVVSASATSLTVKVPAGASNQPVSVATFNRIAYYRLPFTVTFPSIANNFTAASFDTSKDIITGNGNSDVAAGDFDGDGKPDLAVANKTAGTVIVLKNNSVPGGIAFSTATTLTSRSPAGVCVADMNGDGKPDILDISYDGGFEVKLNTSSGGVISFTNNYFPIGPWEGIRIAAGDLDGDGKTDVVLVSEDLSSNVSILRNTTVNGALSFTLGPLSPVSAYTGQGVTLTDVDGDGKPDLVLSFQLGQMVSVSKNTSVPGTISFGATSKLGTSTFHQGLSSADFDGDGLPDLAFCSNYVTGAPTVSVYKNNSNSSALGFSSAGELAITDAFYGMAAGDLDGDGKQDIVAGNGSPGLSIYKNSSAGNISFQPRVGYTGPALGSYSVILVDLDGDGRPDVVSSSRTALWVTALRNRTGEAAVKPSGASPVTGPVSNTVTLDSTVQTLNGSPYVQRHYDIIPSNNPTTATATVTLYFTQQDFDNYNAAPGHGADLPKNATDAAGKANLRVYQYHGFSVNGQPGSYGGTAVEINPDDNNIVWNATAGWWEVTFDVNGFSGFFVASQGFNYNQVPAPVIKATGATSACVGSNVSLTASVALGNQWYKDGTPISGATGSTYTATVSGSYTVTATNNGVTSPASAAVLVAFSPAPAKPVITRNGSDLLSSAASGNQWYREGVLISGATAQSYRPGDAAGYSVRVTVGGCTGPESDRYNFSVTGVINIDNTHYIRLAPNPVNDRMWLSFNLEGVYTLGVTIVDIQGRVGYSADHLSTGAVMDVSRLAAGVYFVKIYSSNGKQKYNMKMLKR
ncbi:MAG: VCBS repeat-containing protein, partial [Bacteroidetes bacterium]|nr:VCBS repeat-containing protein [Bacteroidota bacterium]